VPKLYLASEVAHELGVPKSTIQFYHQIGMINSCERTKGGYHLFSQGSIEKMKLILRWRNEDKLTVEEVKKKLKEMGLI
jgi:DNA-binding transcriptional MerR regulator